MTTTTIRNSLSIEKQRSAAGELQGTLADLIDLALQAKQAHWNVRGSHFRSIHAQLDEMVSEYRTWSDLVAERIVTVGIPADGRARSVAESSSVADFPAGYVQDRDVVDAFIERLSEVSGLARERMDRLGEIDASSQDILIDVVLGMEKQLWMLQAQDL